jgi:hypothetical protein
LLFQSIHGLAKTYASVGRLEEAEALFTECLEKSSRVLGDNHPKTVEVRSDFEFMQQGAAEMRIPDNT